jgi:septum formation protein
MRLILASASPRRAELLSQAGFRFGTMAVDIDERLKAGEAPEAYVRRLAIEKSASAQTAMEFGDAVPAEPDGTILGADTAVVVDGAILGKPADDDDARAMLGRLSGRTHEVLTGVSLRYKAREVGAVERTAVTFAVLRDEEADWYVQTGEGRDKAGAYAVQGLASRFVLRIDGSYSNVVGLPIATVYELLLSLHPVDSRAMLNSSSSRKSL